MAGNTEFTYDGFSLNDNERFTAVLRGLGRASIQCQNGLLSAAIDYCRESLQVRVLAAHVVQGGYILDVSPMRYNEFSLL